LTRGDTELDGGLGVLVAILRERDEQRFPGVLALGHLFV